MSLVANATCDNPLFSHDMRKQRHNMLLEMMSCCRLLRQKVMPQTTSSGDLFWELGNNKRCSISRFNDVLYIHFRQYNVSPMDEDKLLPTKKGIALNPTEFNELKAVFDSVAEHVKEQEA